MAPYTGPAWGGGRGLEEIKEVDPSDRWVGGRFKKQRNLYKACSEGSKTRRSIRTLKVYIEALQSHIWSSGLNNTLALQHASLKMAPTVGIGW